MKYFCEGCQDYHDLSEMEPALRVPEPVLQLSDVDVATRLEVVSFDAMILDGARYFLRGLVPIQIRAEKRTFNVGTWAEVDRDAYDAMMSEERTSAPARGRIANRIPMFGTTMDLEVEIRTEEANQVPRFFLDDMDVPLARAQRDGMAYEDVIEFMHVFTHASERADGNILTFAQRAAALRRIREVIAKNLKVEIAPPAPGTELRVQVGFFGPVEGEHKGQLRYLWGERAEEVVSQADQEILGAGEPPTERHAVAVFDLDRELQVFSRTYTPDGWAEDTAPLPTLATVLSVVALPDGEIALAKEDGRWVPVVGALSKAGAESYEWLSSAARLLDTVAWVPEAALLGSEAKKHFAWVAEGDDALLAASSGVYVYERMLEGKNAGTYLALPETRARELVTTRLEQCRTLVEWATSILMPEEPVAHDVAERASAAVAKRLEQLNRRAAGRSGLLKLVRQAG